MNENTTTQNDTAKSADEIIDNAVNRATAELHNLAPKKPWSWKRISMYAGVAVVATAATYVGVKVMRKPKAVEAVADAASAVVDAVAPAA